MTQDPDRFDEALERLLEEDPSQRAGQEPDPLLQLSLQLRDRLEPTSPDPWFRARLKAELLQKAADNVRPFPIAARLADASSVSRWHRARRAVVALAVAGAASIGLAVGYSGLHQETRPHHTVALLAPPTASATAVPISPTATPAPVRTARVATPRRGSDHNGDPGNTDTPPTYPTHAPRRLPSNTPVIVTPAPRIVANNINPTHTPLTRTPLPAASPTATARTTTAPTATSGHANPTAAVRVALTATPVDTAAPTRTPRPTATHTAVTTRPTATRTAVNPRPTATHTAANPRPTATRVAATQHPVVTSPMRVPPSSTATAATRVSAHTTPRSSTPARQSPTATPEPDSPTAARPRPSATTARPTATPSRPSPTPVPTRKSHEPRATATPRHGINNAATASMATATAAPASATETPALATAIPTQPESSSTPAPSATAASTATVAPTSTATQEPATVAPTVIPAPSDTPPATATASPSPTAGPPLVAQVTASATAGGILNAAAHAAGSPTVVVPVATQFPAPSQLNAAPDSPLAHTTPFTPGVLLRLPAAFAPDPVSLAVYKPASAQQSPIEQLRVFGLQPSKVLSDTRMRAVAIVSADSRFYRADYQSRSTGFRLRLALLTAVPASASQPPSFDAASSARTFLGAHQLAGDGQQLDAVTTLADGTRAAHFSEYAPDQIVGARATISFNSRGVLVAADIQWVFTSVAPLEPAISSAAALDSVAAGNGFVNASGALPDGTSTITGTTILYLPVTAPDGTYYEPVYRLSGLTATGSAFQVYVSALDRAYLR